MSLLCKKSMVKKWKSTTEEGLKMEVHNKVKEGGESVNLMILSILILPSFLHTDSVPFSFVRVFLFLSFIRSLAFCCKTIWDAFFSFCSSSYFIVLVTQQESLISPINASGSWWLTRFLWNIRYHCFSREHWSETSNASCKIKYKLFLRWL